MPKYQMEWVDMDTDENRLEIFSNNERGTVSESGREKLGVCDSGIFKEMERVGDQRFESVDIDNDGYLIEEIFTIINA